MYIVSSYTIAVIFCVVTMLCWGSWANTSKCTNEKWPFTLFYWDYSFGLILAALIYGLTMGSTGTTGRSFLEDIAQADVNSIVYALAGGAIFNLSNLLVIGDRNCRFFGGIPNHRGLSSGARGNFSLYKSSNRQPIITFSWGSPYCNRYYCERHWVFKNFG